MRLIDADALRNAMFNSVFLQNTEMQKWDYGCWIRYKLFENCLEAAPTVDAEPVRHGRWINDTDTCSECGQYVYHGDSRNYCPNCGAKMDEEVDHDKRNGDSE